MWKVFLAFLAHRGLLLLVALVTLATVESPTAPSVWDRFFEVIESTPVVGVLEQWSEQPFSQVIQNSRNPFHWACLALHRVSGLSMVLCLLVVSNLCLLLFLSELVALFNRMVTTDVSTMATIFVVLWPTSFEMSLGSDLALGGYFVALSVRQALDQHWWVCGLAAAMLALVDPIALGVLPVLLYLFWGVQRFLPAAQWSRNLAFLLVPWVLGALLSGRGWTEWGVAQSAALNLFQGGQAGQGFFSHSTAGQTISMLFFFLGAAGALFSNINPRHRFIPLGVWAALLFTSPYAQIASRAPLMGICMEGIASASTGGASQLISLLMILLGAYEVYAVFLG